MDSYPQWIFKTYKTSLGLYLAAIFALCLNENMVLLAPYNTQLAYIPKWMPVYHLLSSDYAHIGVLVGLWIGVLGSLAFAFHRHHKVWVILCWFVWNQLMVIHPLYYLPQDGYIGWFMLLTFFVPLLKTTDWKMPKELWLIAWWVTGVSYFVSGVSKYTVPSWQSVDVFSMILSGGLARDYFLTTWLSYLPDIVMKVFSWLALLIELLILPLSFFERSRKWAWLVILFFHLSILLTINLTSVSFAFLSLHCFLYRADWKWWQNA